MKIEDTIIYNLFHNTEYSGKVISFIKEDYFKSEDIIQKNIFKIIKSFSIKYSSIPTKESIIIDIKNLHNISDDLCNKCIEYVKANLKKRIEEVNEYWLIDLTEKWCKKRAYCNAILAAAELINKEDATQDYNESAKMLEEALAVRFKSDVGLSYMEDSDKQWKYYKENIEKIPFDLEFFNKITNGGVPRKSLTLIAAITNAGKSICLASFAASFLRQGKNVLFITCEMTKEQTRHRIDANLLGINMDQFYTIDKKYYDSQVNKIKTASNGNIFIQEYAMGTSHVGHYKLLMKELKLTRNFIPDVIVIDYLNICTSYRTKLKDSSNSYGYIKTISEELKGLSQETNTPVISACQFNRSGNKNPDVEIDQIGESHGIAMTADLILALIRTEELDQLDQVMWKQLKNRLNDNVKHRRFTTGLDRSRMRLYDVDQDYSLINTGVPEVESQLAELEDKEDVSLFDRSPFGQADELERTPKKGRKRIKPK